MCKELKNVQHQLINMVVTEMENPSQVDTCEIGEVIDMIKDISESMYYCELIEAMKGENSEITLKTIPLMKLSEEEKEISK